MKRFSFKKTFCILLALLMAWGFFACRPKEAQKPAEDNARTEEPFIPANAEEAAAAYEAYPLEYIPFTRKKAEPVREPEVPRYTRGDDGVWRRTDEEESGKAVIMITGDLMCQTRQQQAGKTDKGYSFGGSFSRVEAVFDKADLVAGNLEATLSESAPYMAEQNKVEGYPHLNAPASFLEAVRNAGFDMLMMSNNHNCDAGVRGIYDTIDRVEEYGFIHTGLYRNSEEPRVTLVEVKGMRLAFLNYAASGFNGKDAHLTEEGREALLAAYSEEKLCRDVAQAREAGAEFVFVYIHWGKEYSNGVTKRQWRIAREIANAGADYIIGSHPHALEPYRRILADDGRIVPVFFSLGNFVSHQKKVVSKDTVILRIELKRDASGAVKLKKQGYIPCRVFTTFRGKSYVVIPLTEPYNRGVVSKYIAPAYSRIARVVGDKIEALGRLVMRVRAGEKGIPAAAPALKVGE